MIDQEDQSVPLSDKSCEMSNTCREKAFNEDVISNSYESEESNINNDEHEIESDLDIDTSSDTYSNNIDNLEMTGESNQINDKAIRRYQLDRLRFLKYLCPT